MKRHAQIHPSLLRYFVPPGPGKKSIFQELQKEGFIIIQNKFPRWGPRKSKSNALIYAFFRIIQEEVKLSNDKVCEELFVHAFKDRDAFEDALLEELAKVDEYEMCRGVKRWREDDNDEEPEQNINNPKAEASRIIADLLKKFHDASLVEKSMFFKVMDRSTGRFMAVSHPRIQKKAKQRSYPVSFKGLKLQGTAQLLTNLNSDQMGPSYSSNCHCTMVPFTIMEDELKDTLNKMFGMGEEEEVMDPTIPTLSQYFPYTQPQDANTLKVCDLCRFTCSEKDEMESHFMEIHKKCDICQTYLKDDADLRKHTREHDTYFCNECKKDVKEEIRSQHSKMHVKMRGWGKKKLEAKPEKPQTGYQIFAKQERPKVVRDHPGMHHTKVSAEVGKLWQATSRATKDDFNKRADDHN